MLGISSIVSAPAASEYFAKDNYYSKGEAEAGSSWFGKGAEAAGLFGPVLETDLRKILSGKIGDHQIGANSNAVEHNPGRDFTFSMPKSASILALVGGDKRIMNAYMDAVKEGLTYVEDSLIATRVKNGGRRSDVPTAI